MFCIKVKGRDVTSPTSFGRLQVGEFQEDFEMDLSFWSPRDYERQWRQGLERLVEKEGASCLISSMSRPESANFVFLWLLYRDEDRVFVQQFVLILDECSEAFRPEDPYRHVPSREIVSEDGELVSEWKTEVSEVSRFLAEAPF